jgi:ParB-like chromosome segregation protein Spo0J
MGKNKYQKIETKKIIPIEDHSKARVENLKNKIIKESWQKPIVVFFNKKNNLYHVLDGHHRFQISKDMFLKKIPAIVVKDYKMIKIKSLRENIEISHEKVIQNSIDGKIYPYKTVQHYFDFEIPENINVNIEELV